jgi:glucans biosynthesis protein
MKGGHPRNTGPMLSSRRCGARTRSGKPCRSPAVEGKKRCRMHGGADGSGAPRGNKNAIKHGLYTREAIAQRRQLAELMRQSRKLLSKIE